MPISHSNSSEKLDAADDKKYDFIKLDCEEDSDLGGKSKANIDQAQISYIHSSIDLAQDNNDATEPDSMLLEEGEERKEAEEDVEDEERKEEVQAAPPKQIHSLSN